jgi:alpha-mannosidase
MISGQPASSGTDSSGTRQWLVKVRVPSMGYTTYTLQKSAGEARQSTAIRSSKTNAGVILQADGLYRIETDLYKILIDPAKGGIIKSLVARQLGNKEFVKPGAQRSFAELRGNFYNDGGFRSSTESPAQIRILENGPLRVKLEIKGQIAGNPFTQILSVAEGQRRIDLHLAIDWKQNTGIGESPDAVKGHPLEKAFYNDSFKLQALFPLNLVRQKVYKNAPFDVLQSKLPHTFFNSWDSIKNVVLLNWVDLTDGSDQYGMALLSDHTTSYAHGPRYPLGLTVQYSGIGVFGRDYTLTAPSELSYALIPHAGKWDRAGIWTASAHWNEPLLAKVSDESSGEPESLSGGSGKASAPGGLPSAMSVISMDKPGWEISSMFFSNSDLLVRLFNAEGDGSPCRIYFACKADSVRLVALNGNLIRLLKVKRDVSGRSFVELSMPRFGIRTIQFVRAGEMLK